MVSRNIQLFYQINYIQKSNWIGDERDGKFPQFLTALGIKVNEEEEEENEEEATGNNTESGTTLMFRCNNFYFIDSHRRFASWVNKYLCCSIRSLFEFWCWICWSISKYLWGKP